MNRIERRHNRKQKAKAAGLHIPSSTPELEQPAPSKLVALAQWGICLAVAALYVMVLFAAPFPQGSVVWLYPLALAAPGLITILVLPGAWRRWYRWATIVFLGMSVYPDSVALILGVGVTWALHRSWITERTTEWREVLLFRGRKSTPQTELEPEPEPA